MSILCPVVYEGNPRLVYRQQYSRKQYSLRAQNRHIKHILRYQSKLNTQCMSQRDTTRIAGELRSSTDYQSPI